VLDLDAVLATLCEEAQAAFAADAVVVSLYDPQQDALVPAAGRGLSVSAADLPSLPRAVHERAIQRQGPDMLIPDLEATAPTETTAPYRRLGIRGLAYATLLHEQQLVGTLVVISLGQPRQFSADERLLLRGLADQAALSLINTRLFKDARQRLNRLQALRAIDIAISSNFDLSATLDVLLEQIATQLHVAAALVLLRDPHDNRLVYAAGRGFRTQALQATRLRWGEGHAGQAAQTRQILAVPDLPHNLGSFPRAPLLVDEGFLSYFAAPLIVKGDVRGVLEVFDRAPQAPNTEWLAFLESLAGQAAIAIDNTTLFRDLQRSHAELELAYDATIEGWSAALDLRDHETEGHTQRVTAMTVALAGRVGGFTPAELVHVRRGALLHDIGKMGIPDSILHKPGGLSEAEWQVMRLHPQLAYDLLRSIDYLRPALDIPHYHHEWWDGTGYPSGLAGAAIPRAARLFSVVDVWDALRSDRPYRAAWPEDKVRAYLRDRAGTQFEPALVEAFLSWQDELAASDPPPA
jgi:HD-GYP domain-containing protein (c-di-GMP phosphodiesterase class II)